MTHTEDDALDEFIDEQLAKGYICPSISPYALSFFFIKKKDGKLRPVQDYRNINKWTVRNQYPLPLITTLIRELGGAMIYTKLDILYDGDTTTFALRQETNTKRCSKHGGDSMNPP